MPERESLKAFKEWLRHRGDVWRWPQGYLIRDALIGEAFSARMYADNPDISPETRQAYLWAERQFNRIASGKVDERDLIG